ncbi:MBL fold metallo-hydrolase [Streptomyces sp. W4I9-2]|uniref:MBL fold metallo-hydrolase n=1 Tax=Streptomyces sp. W4I9-2 TaxID=3042297 RepID=UPI002782AD8E|nr:MBL fold metallo-hydrolase [Streptomyces sp. W4I9-2]MDQ0701119.1 L-ascorbate metabolism protein UlaG (beta-lactamase superfamily) [Streptomyces sp. W4I9-2]
MSSRDTPVKVQFVGNATLLLRYGPLTLLTDPNFLHRGQHAHLGYGLVTKRLKQPALTVGQLPDLDAIVLSHLHGDHWDRVARRKLDRALPVLTTPQAARVLRTFQGFNRATGLRDWEHRSLVKEGHQVRLTAMPGRHALGPLRGLLPRVMGSMLEFGPEGGPVRLRVYVSGDTLLHLGGTRLPGGLVVTMDGRQGAEFARRLGTRFALPVHYDDYSVMKSPLSAFLDEMARRGLEERVVHCDRGQIATLAPGGAQVHVR